MSWKALRMVAEQFDAAQRARITCENRVRAQGHPDEYAPQVAAVAAAEKLWGKALVAEYVRTVPEPVRAWQDAARGVGEHSLALLLGATGHPVHAQPYTWMNEPPAGHECDPLRCKKNSPAGHTRSDTHVPPAGGRHLVALEPYDRTLGQWLSYCGYGDPTRRRRTGMSADDAMALGNARAKRSTHVLADGVVKHQKCATCKATALPGETWQVSKGCTDCGPYRQVYVARRAELLGRDLSDGHAHNDALRIMKKAILKDIYRAAL